MRILVTRHEDGSESTAKAVRALGHQAMLAPLLRIETFDDVYLGEGPWSAVLFTSANATRAVAVHPRKGELLGLPALAVGRSTARAARAAGFGNVISADGDGGDLARLAAACFGGLTILYLAGADRARDLAGEVSGLRVQTTVVYRAVPVDSFPADAGTELRSRRIDGVLHFSRRSAESYLACAESMLEAALAPAHYCLSVRVAEPLKAAGAARVFVAERPDEAALLALVAPRP